MGLRKIWGRRSGKSTPEPRTTYEFEPPASASCQVPQDGSVEDGSVQHLGTLAPSRFLRPQLSLNSLASKSSWEPPFRSDLNMGEHSSFRLRNLSSIRRPSTAASSDSTYFDHTKGLQRPRREPRKPPVSFRKPSSSASLSMSYQASSTEDRGSDIASLSLGIQRRRSNSITSVGSGRFKDLLDAQEEIRSIDFRTRIEATGSRDYGEDVADRNMQQYAMGNHDAFLHAPSSLHNDSSQDVPLPSGGPVSSAAGHRTQSLTSSNPPLQQDSFPLTRNRLESPTIPDTASLKEPQNKATDVRPNTNRFSLNTYTPSGLTSSNMSGVTFTHDGFGSPVCSVGGLDSSRPHCVSPTGSNFSVPRSPRPPAGVRFASKSLLVSPVNHAINYPETNQAQDLPASKTHSRKLSAGSRFAPFSVPTVATSGGPKQSHRYSFASSVTSRHTSVDYTALPCPRGLSNETHGFSDSEGVHEQERSRPSRPQSQYVSGDELFGQISTMSSGLRPGPSVLKRFGYVEDHGIRLHSPDDANHEWETPASSNTGSASVVSDPSYSGSSGRPHSRNTKRTSVDSSHPVLSSRWSEDSCHSTTFGRAISPGCSPITTEFNIDDYISSDDESFSMERKPRRPLAEGEEDLLFKAGYGTNGASLPGLLEAIDDDPCPFPVVRDSQKFSVDSNSILQHDDDDNEAGTNPAILSTETEDDTVSVDRDLPATFVRHSQHILEQEKGTFGRRRVSGRLVTKNALSPSNTESTCVSGDSDYFTPPTSANEAYMYDEEPIFQRGLQRLSAFGTWHGRNFTAGDILGIVATNNKDEPPLPENISGGDEKERVDISSTIRARKAAKAQKRAEDAKTNQQKRMTRTFGNLEQEISALLRMQDHEDEDQDEVLETNDGRRTTSDRGFANISLID